MSLSNKIVRKFSHLSKDTAGHVAVIFALAIIPIITIAGFAIDFQNTTSRKVQVQAAVDTAVIAGARAMQAGKTSAQIRDEMKAYVNAMVETNNNGLTCNDPEISLPQGTQDIVVNIRCAQQAIISQIVGQNEIEFDVSSTSTWGVGKLDVAFMFDVSGSMASNNRMTSLKAAALEALETLKPAEGGPGTDDVRIAMVSYNDMVNAGDYFEEVTGLSPTRTYYAIDKYKENEQVQETYTVRERVCDTETVCTRFYTSGGRRGQCRPNAWVTRETNCRWEDVEKTRWITVEVDKERTVSRTLHSTCVWERTGNNAFTDAVPQQNPDAVNRIDDAQQIIYNISADEENTGNYLSAGYAWFYDRYDDRMDNTWYTSGTSCRNHKPLALTKNRTVLDNYVNGLTTGGGTAGHQGIAWAWYMVSEKWDTVFTGDSAPLPYDEPDSVKAVILMTDGDFLHQRFGNQGSSMQQAKDVCDAMKAQDKVIIYTVAFQAPNKGKEVLKYCASGPEFSFEPQNGQQLSQAYQAIATSISDLRIKF